MRMRNGIPTTVTDCDGCGNIAVVDTELSMCFVCYPENERDYLQINEEKENEKEQNKMIDDWDNE